MREGTSRLTDCWVQLTAILLLLIGLAPSLATAQEDLCEEHGGTAHCVGPNVGPWTYRVSDGHNIGLAPTEAAAIADYDQNYRNNIASTGATACTVSITDAAPAWPPIGIGNGWASQGSYGSTPFWSVSWALSTETNAMRDPLRVFATISTPDNPNCSGERGPHRANVIRSRDVQCPAGYAPNLTPPITYCYRAGSGPDKAKNFGSCPGAQRGLSSVLGNPVNIGTGNKYQLERDYQANGLDFSRHYNSHLWMGTSAPSSTLNYRSALGINWRSSYDRSIRYTGSLTFATTHAYRPDGRTLSFKLKNGAYHADQDISDRLVRLTDGSGNITGWVYTISESEDKETYDADGRLISIQARSGTSQALAYDGAGRLQTVTNNFGQVLTFGYDSSGRLTSLTDPNGQIYTYAYSPVGNVASVTYPDGKQRSYIYNESANTDGANRPFLLTGIVDEANIRFSTYKYLYGELVAEEEHAGGVRRYQFSYPGAAVFNQATVTDPLMQQRTYTMSPLHGVFRVTSVNQPCTAGCSSAQAVTYDANANVSSTTDYNSNKTCYQYDLGRNLELARLEGVSSASACPTDIVNYTPPSGSIQRKVTTTWNANHRLPAQIDEFGRRTTFTHDASGNVLTRTELDTTTSVSRTWTHTYNSFGRVLTADGPRTDLTDVTTYTYYNCATGYQCGQVRTITNAAGHVTTYNTYNAHGQPLMITDPNGVVTTLTYDQRQRLTSRTVGTEVTSFTYWPTGLLKKSTLPDGSYLEYTYDAAHRLTEINDAEGNRIHYTLDNMGNRTGEQAYDPSNALTRTRTRVFNALSRLQQEIGAAGTANVTTTFGYDSNGNQTSIAAPLGRDTTQGYDELNRLTSVTDPINGVTAYGYNALDQLISVTDPKGLVTSYAYNALGDLKQQTSPDTGVTSNTYDSGGNLATSTDARTAVTSYTYDALNRVSTAAFTIGTTTDQTLNYAYDNGTHGKGKLTGVSDSNHSLSWTYDDQGRVLAAGQTVGSVSKTTSYSYANGLRQSMTTPSGQVITYGYTNGKITSISVNGTVLVSNILYDPFGPVRQWAWGNGSLSVRTFDQDGKITQLDSAGLKTYTYDDAFRITGITDTTNAALSWTYGYDDLDRLTSANKTGTTQGYTYDANGNRLTRTGSSVATFNIAANSNRLTSTSGALARSYTYDNAGNATYFGGLSYAYNARGRMKSSIRNGVTTTYTHNALGQLIKKGTNALFYYDEAGHILGIYTGAGALTEEIVWLGDIPLATLRPKSGGGVNVFYIHTDHLNTPKLITTADPTQVRWRWDGDPFGIGGQNTNPNGLGTFEFSLRFPGQMYFVEPGLAYNYFRDYDPSTGRYVQSDPIGLDGGLNTYAYAVGNPISNYDPDGLAAQGGVGAVAAIAVCLRIPACRKAVQDAIRACKDVQCKVTRHTAHHKFPGLGYCEHMQIVCFVKGGGQLFRAQFPLPGRCSKEKSPGEWLPDGGRDIPFDQMPFGE